MMGVLNCTPDSFSDGGLYPDVDAAVAHGLQMQSQGAAIIDVGGESTRPGAEPVSLADELRRVIPVVRQLVVEGCTVSIDTTKAEVMRQAIGAGACMVNDVSALRGDADALAVVAESGVDVCLMHMQGTPATMQQRPGYDDVFEEVCAFFDARIRTCLDAGVRASAIILDPGIGFGKRLEDNLELLRRVADFKRRFDMPLLIGVSRKSFLGTITGSEVSCREMETAAVTAVTTFLGADMHRVHDVPAQIRAMKAAAALRRPQ